VALGGAPVGRFLPLRSSSSAAPPTCCRARADGALDTRRRPGASPPHHPLSTRRRPRSRARRPAAPRARARWRPLRRPGSRDGAPWASRWAPCRAPTRRPARAFGAIGPHRSRLGGARSRARAPRAGAAGRAARWDEIGRDRTRSEVIRRDQTRSDEIGRDRTRSGWVSGGPSGPQGLHRWPSVGAHSPVR